MRLIKMFGLASIAAVAAMAFVGASSAMATGSTSICTVNQEPCLAGNLATTVKFLQVGVGTLLTNFVNVLCLGGHFEGKAEGTGLANPLVLEVLKLEFLTCGTNAAHNNCTVTTTVLGKLDVLRTAAKLGTATALNIKALVECPTLGLKCIYGAASTTGFTVESAGHTAGAGKGMFTATKVELGKEGGSGFFCPTVGEMDSLFEPEAAGNLYIST